MRGVPPRCPRMVNILVDLGAIFARDRPIKTSRSRLETSFFSWTLGSSALRSASMPSGSSVSEQTRDVWEPLESSNMLRFFQLELWRLTLKSSELEQ